ncbi:hypothetical protein SALBM217S_05848 [Streptomyces griseoloalbus]
MSSSIDSAYTPNLSAYNEAFTNDNYHLAAAEAGAARARRVRALLRVPVADQQERWGRVSLQTPARTVPSGGPAPASEGGTPPRGGISGVTTRSRILVTGLLVAAAGYFLLPVYWLAVASTSSTATCSAASDCGSPVPGC